MISLIMIAEHYNRIFDESMPTHILQFRKNIVDDILPLIASVEKMGTPLFMAQEIFEPFLNDIETIESEEDMKKISDALEKLRVELGGLR